MRLDAYIRVSKVGQREGYQSPDEQRGVIRLAAERAGVALGLEVVEEDVSGARAASERGLERLLARAETGESDGVVVAFQDRLSRGSLLEQAEVWERLGRAGARLLTGDGLDSAAPGQELLFNIRAAIARDQWQRYRDGWSRTVRGRVERGLHHCATAPVGYRFTVLGLNRRGDPIRGPLEPDPATGAIVRRMFERRAAGEGHADLSRWLRAQGVELTTQGVQKALRNDVYLGIARYGETRAEGAHEPLVDRLTWDRAQASRGRGVRVTRTGVVSGGCLTVGLAVCAVCGRRLVTSVIRGRVQLKCRDAHHEPVSVMGAALDEHVASKVLTWRRRVSGLEFDRPSGRAEAARKALEAREYDMGLFLENLGGLAALGRDEWNRQAARHREAVQAARAEAVAAAAEEEAAGGWTRLHERWEAADAPGRRAILSRLVERVTVRPVGGARGVPAAERATVELRP